MEPIRRGVTALTLLGGLCACDAPQQARAPAPPPPPAQPVAVLNEQQVQQRATQCESKARDRFQRDSKQVIAEFAHHYHRKLDTCFYLLTVSHQDTRSRKLLDILENETYGEFRGQPGAEPQDNRHPDLCKVEAMYCASEREWEVLVRQFMED
jgi:hypothetical protein